MPLVNDIDLLRLEPRLFTQAANVAALKIDGADAAISGTELSSVSALFETKDIDTRHVIIVDNEPLEIDSRTDENTLEVSRRRMNTADEKLEPGDGTTLAWSVRTFEHLLNESQQWLFGTLHIDIDALASSIDSDADPAVLLNADEIGQTIALRAAARSFAIAAADDPDNTTLAALVSLYQRRAQEAQAMTRALLDFDGDGIADATRRLNVSRMVRV